MRSASLVVAALLVIIINSNTEAVFIMVEGGYCLTYKSSIPGTLITFEPCKFDDPKQKNWKFIKVPSGASLVCIGDTNICDQVGADGKEYLAKKDANEPAQQWTEISGDRFTNGLTGPNHCSQAIFNADGDNLPDYLQLKRCSENRHQKFVTFSSSSRLAEYFYHKLGASPLYPYPLSPIYPYYHYQEPIIPYYYTT